MLFRAFLIWLVVLVLANLNDAFRELLLTPRVGPQEAHQVSTPILCALVGLTAWLSVRWIGPTSARDGWLVGARQ